MTATANRRIYLPLVEGRMMPKGHFFNEWQAKIPADVTLEDILDPKFWSSCAVRLNTYDVITCVAEDNSYRAQLLVLDAHANKGARLRVLDYLDLTAAEEGAESPVMPDGLEDNYEVKYRGFAKWSVIRKTDKKVIAENLATEADAVNELRSHLKAMVA